MAYIEFGGSRKVILMPGDLYESPNFIRYFDGHTRGSTFRVLMSKVWRETTQEFKSKTASKSVFFSPWRAKLCAAYDGNHLTCYMPKGMLESLLGVTDRTARNAINDLIKAKLIRKQKIDGTDHIPGTFYTLGVRSDFVEPDGFTTGREGELYYIHSWVTLVKEHGPEALDAKIEELFL